MAEKKPDFLDPKILNPSTRRHDLGMGGSLRAGNIRMSHGR